MKTQWRHFPLREKIYFSQSERKHIYCKTIFPDHNKADIFLLISGEELQRILNIVSTLGWFFLYKARLHTLQRKGDIMIQER